MTCTTQAVLLPPILQMGKSSHSELAGEGAALGVKIKESVGSAEHTGHWNPRQGVWFVVKGQ